MALDWAPANFSAFSGTAKLDAGFLQQTVTQVTNNLDLKADIQKFRDWLNLLRADPSRSGIPDEHLTDVKNILDAFFPLNPGSSTEFSTIRVRGVEDPPQSGQRSAVPFTVSFGTGPDDLQIVDASTALGYIFSIVTPTTANPTWQTYYLPLLAIFSRCLYLAFIAHPDLQDDLIITSVTDVPRFSCVMYVGSAVKPQRYFYSSTVAMPPSNIREAEVERWAQRNMLDKWRRTQLLDASLIQVPTGAGEPFAEIQDFAPRYVKRLADELFSNIRAAHTISQASKPVWTTLSASFVAAYLQGPPQQAIPPIPLDLDRLKGHKVIGAKLEELLIALVNLRLDAKYRDADLRVANAVHDFFAAYLTPHAFLPTDLTFTNEIPDPNSFTTLRDATILTFSQSILAQVLIVLNALYAKEKENNFKQDVPFGRCAETYCVTCLLPHYFSWLGQTNPSMGDVRGILMSVPDVGSSLGFQNAFTSVELGQAGARGPYRLPCDNCKALLPVYKLDMSDAGYNADIMAIPSQISPPF